MASVRQRVTHTCNDHTSSSQRRIIWTQVFLDLEISGSGATAELVLKPNDSLTAADVHDFRDSIKLGDVISAGGSYETGSCGVFLVSTIRTVSAWKDKHPHEGFVYRALQDGKQPETPGSDHCNHLHPGTTLQTCQGELACIETARDGSTGDTLHPAVCSNVAPMCSNVRMRYAALSP